ncbi:tail fiber domain-containing protein [Atlantibacter hermannii]|uniref:tail fiber domain-containing protein n=2 Tax=Atlantibacter hermannii TaxID=565 RepID=UPI002FD95A66
MSAGTLKLTNNSTAVAGTSTVFTTDLKPGDFITATIGGVLYTLPVDTVTSNTAATLVSPFTGPTTTGAAWAAVPRKIMNQVTAELVNQSTAAIRALLAEKGNWTKFYTAPGDITMQFADNVAPVSGPGWQKMAGMAASALNDLGIGLKNLAVLGSFDWQQFDALSGQICFVAIENMANLPPGITFKNGTGVYVLVNGTSSGGTRFSLEIIPDTATDSNYKIYKVLVVGAKGARTFSVRQVFTNTDVVPVANGGTGATTAAEARAELGVAYGITAGTVAQGNDKRLNTVDGKSGGVISGTVKIEHKPAGVYPFGASELHLDNIYSVDGLSKGRTRVYNEIEQSSGAQRCVIAVNLNGANEKYWTFDYGSGSVTAPGAFIPNSDGRIKTNKKRIEDPLSKMRQMFGYTWTRLDGGQWGIGFIAQEIQEIFPQAVHEGGSRVLDDGTVVKGILSPDTYGVAAALHHESILTLMDKIESQQTEIEALKSSMEELKKMVEGLNNK